MKKLFLFSTLIFLVGYCFSQSRYTVVEFNKKEVPGVIGEIPFIESTVMEAIDKNFEKQGYKSKKIKGYYLYSSVILKELGEEPHDIYVLVERKSRQEKDVSLVTFLISTGFDNFISDVTDINIINSTKSYINSLKIVAAAYDLELQIIAQEEALKKSIKKIESLADDSVSLYKRKKKVEEEIFQKSIEQTNQRADKVRQGQILETLKAKRKVEVQ